MGLADLYNEYYGTPEGDNVITKLADALGADEQGIAQALFDEGMIDEEGNWLEQLDEETEKVAADWDAAGRIMAQGLMDELEKEGAGLLPRLGKIVSQTLKKEPAKGVEKLKAILSAARAKAGTAAGKAGEIAKKPAVAGVGGLTVGGGLGYAAGRR